MQHMAVVRAFAVPALELLTVTASSGNPTLVPNANIVVSGSGVSRTVTVTPAANQTGTATITVTGGDGVSTASDTFVLTVGAAPVITSTNNYSGTVGVAGTNYVTATGSVPMSYGASNLPVGLSIISSSGMISGTPTQAGVKQVVLTASNSYGSAIRTNAFVISKGTVVITAVPTASAITVGQALSVSVLSGGTASVAGAFAWTTPTTVPAVGTASYGVTFTPTDMANYNTAATTVSVTVNPAGSTFAGAYPGKIITDIAPNGFTYLANYGFGGSEGIAPTLPMIDSSDPTKLKLIVVVRTDDSSISLGGQTTMDLAGGWSASGVAVDPSTDASPVPANTVRKVISVDRGSGSNRFLRATITK
jgi:hypothetical protein